MSQATFTLTMNAEEFSDWASQPENTLKQWELVAGEPIEMPPPVELHGTVCWLISFVLGQYLFQRGEGYICTNDTGLIVERDPDTVRGPDLMLFLESRHFEDLQRRYTDRVPTLIVEVLSPTDRFSQILRRVDQYLQHGVPLVWVVDPEDRVVHQFKLRELRKVFTISDTITGDGILPAFSTRVHSFFALPGSSNVPLSSS